MWPSTLLCVTHFPLASALLHLIASFSSLLSSLPPPPLPPGPCNVPKTPQPPLLPPSGGGSCPLRSAVLISLSLCDPVFPPWAFRVAGSHRPLLSANKSQPACNPTFLSAPSILQSSVFLPTFFLPCSSPLAAFKAGPWGLGQVHQKGPVWPGRQRLVTRVPLGLTLVCSPCWLHISVLRHVAGRDGAKRRGPPQSHHQSQRSASKSEQLLREPLSPLPQAWFSAPWEISCTFHMHLGRG